VIALVLFAAVTAAAGPCHTVHGRMELWNGSPTVRIVVGKRVLGVDQPNQSIDDLPAGVRRIWTGKDPEADWRTSIHGDFKVCPLAADRPGRMQPVTLIEAVHLVARPRP
jgi:hypothetical protein